MCPNCNSLMFDFAKDNPNMRITIYEGTTGINPWEKGRQDEKKIYGYTKRISEKKRKKGNRIQ